MQTLRVTSNQQSTLRTGRERQLHKHASKARQTNARSMPLPNKQKNRQIPNQKEMRHSAAREYLTKTTAQSDASRFREGTRLHGQQNRGGVIPSLRGDASRSTRHREREREREREHQNRDLRRRCCCPEVHLFLSFCSFASSSRPFFNWLYIYKCSQKARLKFKIAKVKSLKKRFPVARNRPKFKKKFTKISIDLSIYGSTQWFQVSSQRNIKGV